MKLNLEKPMAFFDLETTGLNISADKIIEIAILKVHPDASEEAYEKRVNPEMEISEESTSIHGITNEDVKGAPTFRELAQEIKEFIGDADLAGYNSNRFDIPFLLEELLNCNVELEMEGRRYVDVQTIFHKMEQRTLEAAYKFYCDKDLKNAHSAAADTLATYEVLKGQLDRYEELENNVDYLFEFSQAGKNRKVDFVGRLAINEKEEIIYNFGKHNGKTIREVYEKEPGYHRWMLDNDFPLITKNILRAESDKIIAEIRKKKQENKERYEQKLNSKLDQLKDKFNQ